MYSEMSRSTFLGGGVQDKLHAGQYIRAPSGTTLVFANGSTTFTKCSNNSAGVYVSTHIRKIPVQEIFREMAPIPVNVRTYPKVCVGKRLEYR